MQMRGWSERKQHSTCSIGCPTHMVSSTLAILSYSLPAGLPGTRPPRGEGLLERVQREVAATCVLCVCVCLGCPPCITPPDMSGFLPSFTASAPRIPGLQDRQLSPQYPLYSPLLPLFLHWSCMCVAPCVLFVC
ncbi:UNVERIFIED_CONTAM: hypothetical protein K2H54_062914 [Gekko kuhli]